MGRAAMRIGVLNRPFEHCDRRRCGEMLAKLRPLGQLSRQLGAKESRHRQDFIDLAQPVERQVSQAAAHGIAHHERAGQHGRSRGHSQRHGEMNPTLVDHTFD